MTIINDQFEAQLMQAVVRQFFENPPIVGTLPDGQYVNIQPRSTPAQVVTAQLLTERNGELLAAIMAAVDVDVLAQGVAAEVLKTLTRPDNRYGYDRTAASELRKRLKEKVDARLVELLAQEMFAQMKADEGDRA